MLCRIASCRERLETAPLLSLLYMITVDRICGLDFFDVSK